MAQKTLQSVIGTLADELNSSELGVVIDNLQSLRKEKYLNEEPYELELVPEYMSKTGMNLFEVLNCNTVYKYHRKQFTVRLEMCKKQTKVVRIINSEGNNNAVIKTIKEAIKNGDRIFVALDDIKLLSYSFNHSSGICMYSSGVRVVYYKKKEEKI